MLYIHITPKKVVITILAEAAHPSASQDFRKDKDLLLPQEALGNYTTIVNGLFGWSKFSTGVGQSTGEVLRCAG